MIDKLQKYQRFHPQLYPYRTILLKKEYNIYFILTIDMKEVANQYIFVPIV